MLDMEFVADIQDILAGTAEERQLFSFGNTDTLVRS